jgi:glycerol-3-phosphate acyltransferase PlsY
MMILQSELIYYYLISYLLGSIPTAVWIGKTFYGVDIRDHGSLNAGATNTYRVLGRRAALPVLLIDIFKGFLATSLVHFNADLLARDSSSFVLVKLICGTMAVFGHLFPVFAGFRGGKGVATMFGMLIGLHPLAASLSFAAFAITYFISGFVSMGSILGSLVFVFLIIFVLREDRTAMVVFGILQFTLILYTHRKNVIRLLNGDEKPIRLFGKKRSEL